MANKENFYGSDGTDNTFFLAGKDGNTITDKKYFPLVNKKTGEVELWEDNDDGFLRGDKRIGTINEKEEMEYNSGWFNNVSEEDRELINNNIKDIKKQAQLTAANGIRDDNPTLSPQQARNQAKKLTNKNKVLTKEDYDNTGQIANEAINEARNKLGPAQTGTREKDFGVHVFPTTLRTDKDAQDFLKFDMMAYKPSDIKGDHNNIKSLGIDREPTDRESIGTVVLPIPGGIRDQLNVQWNSESINAVELAAAQLALTMIEKNVSAGIDVLSEKVQAALETDDTKAAVATYLAGQAAGGKDIMARTTGAIMNPNMELLFNGPQMRNFSFSFLLAPRDDKEAKTVISIIRFFKQGMAPIRSKSRLFLKSPHTFRLAYKHRTRLNKEGEGSGQKKTSRDHPYLNKFKECALGSLGVDYAPNGNYSTYEDGVMTAYRLTMNFREMSPIYNDDYKDANPLPAEIGF